MSSDAPDTSHGGAAATGLHPRHSSLILAAWLHGDNPRLSLCEFQPQTGELTELLELTRPIRV